MTPAIFAHAGRAAAPHDLWGSWSLDPIVLIALVAALALGLVAASRRAPGWWALAVAVLVLAVALVSPLDAASDALASAHMIQHVLLIGVAAPLLARAGPVALVLRAGPPGARRMGRSLRRGLGVDARRRRILRHPVLIWVLAVASLWAWHAPALYDAAVAHRPVHVIEHLTLLGAAMAFWSAVWRCGRPGGEPGTGVLLLFGYGLATTLLAALMTFATRPWYESYATTTEAWGLHRLADQQLAGVLMWFPTGFLGAGVALWLVIGWLGRAGPETEPDLGPPAALHAGGDEPGRVPRFELADVDLDGGDRPVHG